MYKRYLVICNVVLLVSLNRNVLYSKYLLISLDTCLKHVIIFGVKKCMLLSIFFLRKWWISCFLHRNKFITRCTGMSKQWYINMFYHVYFFVFYLTLFFSSSRLHVFWFTGIILYYHSSVIWIYFYILLFNIFLCYINGLRNHFLSIMRW